MVLAVSNVIKACVYYFVYVLSPTVY